MHSQNSSFRFSLLHRDPTILFFLLPSLRSTPLLLAGVGVSSGDELIISLASES